MSLGSDIYAKLRDEHHAVANLLQRLVKTGPGDAAKRKPMFVELKQLLISHSKAEDAVFYAELLRHNETRPLIQNGQQEHQRIDVLLDELERMDKGTSQWTVRLRSLKDAVEHHVHEEEGQVFTRAKSVLSPQRAEELGRQFDQAKAGKTPTEVKETVRSYATEAAAQEPTPQVRAAGDSAIRSAQHVVDEAKEKGRSLLQEQQHVLAAQLGSVAQALQRTAQELHAQEQPDIARYANQAADGLARFSQTLQQQNVQTLLGQVQDYARRQPAMFVGGAALLGFLAARFLKSSAERQHAASSTPGNEHLRHSQTPSTAFASGMAGQPAGAQTSSMDNTASPVGPGGNSDGAA